MVSKRTLALSAGIAVAGMLATGLTAYAGSGKHGDRHGGHGPRGGVHMMDQFDANEDGKLTQAEIDQARQERLAKFDSDKDGKLNLQEFEALWLDFTRERMVRSFQRLDRDGDAIVTQDEYLEPTKNMVVRMDRNDDGEISRDDMKRRHHGDHDDDRRGDRK